MADHVWIHRHYLLMVLVDTVTGVLMRVCVLVLIPGSGRSVVGAVSVGAAIVGLFTIDIAVVAVVRVVVVVAGYCPNMVVTGNEVLGLDPGESAGGAGLDSGESAGGVVGSNPDTINTDAGFFWVLQLE